MQHAIPVSVSFDEKLIQTVLFEHRDSVWLQKNIAATDQFIAQILTRGFEPEDKNSHTVFYNIPASLILHFLSNYQVHPNSRSLAPSLLSGYIRDQNKYNLVTRWNVVIRGITRRNQRERETLSLGGIELPLIERARRRVPSEHAHIGVLVSRGDIVADLKQDVDQIKSKTTEDLKKEREKHVPGVGLLLIYPISKDSSPGPVAEDRQSQKVQLDAVEHMIGVGIVFPPAARNSRGEQDYSTVDPLKLERDELEWFEWDEEESEEA
jgi:hypothetical protein